MTVNVWHRDNPNFRTDPFAEDEFPKGFTHVATVTCPATAALREYAFGATNHIDHAWWENRGVVKHATGMLRSTSVGDVVEYEDGRAFVVRGIGWEQIRKERS